MRPLIRETLDERQIRAWVAWQGLKDAELRAHLAQRRLFPVSGSGEMTLRKTQAGLEATKGTSVAATRKVYGRGTMTKKVDPIRPADEDRGTFTDNFRSQPGLIEAAFPFAGSVTYEDLPWWAQMWLKGGVTGVLRNVAAYDYTHTPSEAADDLKAATFEWGDETQAFEGAFGMVDTFEISAAVAEAWRFAAGIFIDDMAKTTFTGAIGDRTVEDVLMRTSKLALGAAGALPSSYMTGRFIGFRLASQNALERKYFADGGVSQKYTGMGRGKRHFELEVTFEGNSATIAERDVWEAGTARVARILAEGSEIATSSPATKRTVDLAIAGKWTAFPVGERGPNTVFTAMLEGEYDATLGYVLRLLTTNALSALA